MVVLATQVAIQGFILWDVRGKPLLSVQVSCARQVASAAGFKKNSFISLT